MTKEDGSRWTDDDTNALFATLGRYWIFFQWIEGQLDQILQLGWGFDNWQETHGKLSRMNNEGKIKAVSKMILTSPDFARVHTRPEWIAHFKAFIDALHDERKRRNKIIHSQFIFDWADRGLGPPLMSNRSKHDDRGFEQQFLTREFQRTLLAELGKLVLEVSRIRTQIIHDHKAKI